MNHTELRRRYDRYVDRIIEDIENGELPEDTQIESFEDFEADYGDEEFHRRREEGWI